MRRSSPLIASKNPRLAGYDFLFLQENMLRFNVFVWAGEFFSLFWKGLKTNNRLCTLLPELCATQR